jgi:nucleotide-binding universal stress UspA family protein
MDDIKRIIIPVDRTDASKDAVKKGAFLAKLLGINAKIISVNDTHQFISSVVLEEKLRKDAEAVLDEFKKIGAEMGITLETEIISGNPAEEIVRFVNDDDLIIMAHHEKKVGIDQFMVGSVSRDVVRKAPCSVLVIKVKQ